MRPGRSLAVRAVSALLLMVLFFASALLVSVMLAGLAYVAFSTLEHVRGRAGLVVIVFACACVVASAVILWSLFPRVDRFEPPGPELRDADSPLLLAEIRKIAAATGQAAPGHVYLVGDVNAFVTERGGIMGFGSRRVMGIGLPLLEILSIGELRAVIAHEFGHFYGGDTKLGPWIYKTRGAVFRTVENLAKTEASAEQYTAIFAWVMRVVRAPFGWFGMVFMRITQAISRAQELSADALAARTVGSSALANGLKKTHSGAMAFSAYFRSEVSPVLDAGYRPPITLGYRRFVDGEGTAKIMATVVEEAMRDGEADELDSHPPLRERVAAAEALAMPPRMDDDRPAIELVSDVDALETKLAMALLDDDTITAIGWEQSAALVLVPSWRERQGENRGLLHGMTLGALERDPARLRSLAERKAGESLAEVADDDIRGWAISLFGVPMALALLEQGWEAHNIPGASVLMQRGDARCEPFREIESFLSGATEEAEWHSRMQELAVAETDLGAVAPAAGAPPR